MIGGIGMKIALSVDFIIEIGTALFRDNQRKLTLFVAVCCSD